MSERPCHEWNTDWNDWSVIIPQNMGDLFHPYEGCRIHFTNGSCPTCQAQLNADGSSVDTLLEMRKGLWAMAADLEDAIRHIAELQQRMDALAGTPRAFDPTAPRIEDTLQALAAEVPPEEWERVPSDLSGQHDHYIYGTPRDDEDGQAGT